MISVALCTYNGAKYLAEQLDTILSQTVMPSEVIIGDDGSIDETRSILEKFEPVFSSRGIKFHVETSQENIGVTANFQRTLEATSGEIIFLSDQDDLWFPDRIEKSLQVFADHPEVSLLHSDAELVNQRGEEMGRTIFQSLGFTPADQSRANSGMSFDLLLQRNLVTGATTAIRRTLLESSVPFSPLWLHDEWLALCASAENGYRVISEPLIGYRQHGGNVVGVRKRSVRSDIAYFLASRTGRYERLIQRFSAARRFGQLRSWDDELILKISGRINFDEQRLKYPTNRFARIRDISNQWRHGLYKKYCYSPLTEILRDLLQSK